MQTIARGLCLIALTAAPAAAQVPDIRGLTCEAQIALVLNGNVLDETLELDTGSLVLPALPHAFDILPDPAYPTDPAHILIRTKLPTGPDDTDEVRFELVGQYDHHTGAIDVEGVAYGLHFWETPFATDAFDLLQSEAPIWLQMRDPSMSLHAVVAADVTDTQLMGFDIVGGEPLGTSHAAAILNLNATRVSWLPSGTDDVALALFGPYEITEVTSALTELQAQVVDVFGDVNDDLLLTQADVVQIHKMFGPILDADFEGDVIADGIVDAQDADYLQWLVRCIGNKDVQDTEKQLQGSAGPKGDAPMAGKP